MKKLLLFALLQACIGFNGVAQDTITMYLDKDYKSTDSTKASYIRTAIIRDGRYFITDKNVEGKMVNYSEYKSVNPWIEDGLSKHYVIPDILYSTGNYENGKITGQWVYYASNSLPDTVNYDIIKSTSTSSNSDSLFEKYRATKQPSKEVWQIVDSLSNYYARKFHLPARTRCSNTSNELDISFILDTAGTVKCPHVKGTNDDDFISEALRVLLNYKFNNIPTSPLSIDFKVDLSDIGDQMAEDSTKGEPTTAAKNVIEPINGAAGSSSHDNTYLTADEPPILEYRGGGLLKYISDHIRYPRFAGESGIQGTVYVCFTIEEDGSISEIRVANKANPLLKNEAIRVIKGCPKWKPGKIKGKPVRVNFTFPIHFKQQTPSDANDECKHPN